MDAKRRISEMRKKYTTHLLYISIEHFFFAMREEKKINKIRSNMKRGICFLAKFKWAH